MIGFTFLTVSKVQASTSGFTVNPIFPNNQLNKNQGYFDLVMKPGQKQTISIELSNTTSNPITVDTSFATATTNNNGLAVYDTKNKASDKSLKYKIEDYVSIPSQYKEVTIPANATTTINIVATMPKANFNGVMAGGLGFKEKTNNKPKAKSQSVSIINEYRYVVALIMQQNQTIIAPKLSMNGVEASQVNGRNVISSNLENSAATYLKDMNTQAVVQGITDKNIKYSYEGKAMKMAPNSNFNFAVPVSIQGNPNGEYSKPLKAGKYQLSMTVYGGKDGNGKYAEQVNGLATRYDYKWTFQKEFTISHPKAKQLNASDPTINHKNTDSVDLLTIIGAVLILLLVFIFLMMRRRRRDKAQS
ncbi:DUF916 and DUF3324 domain-containing protein [Lactococcus nasutitermitis]|uniref:DUF916 and DUF3324 domain-containing protein n=1 Tax=Lactococcus nasutitermitis TaxID=1652957 RepID=A0ABV9JHZ0_9LACT|nr:DUF916 and DUF3324 domain-containing protein [Lactococcus nasutitermitis]